MNIIATDGTELNKVPDIVSVKPVGHQILFEELTAQEIQSSTLHIPESANSGPPQGYILEIGPKVDPDWGFEIGDRVILSGKYVPVPNNENHRNRGVVEAHMIKAVLVEND